jgi:hypothetical protein
VVSPSAQDEARSCRAKAAEFELRKSLANPDMERTEEKNVLRHMAISSGPGAAIEAAPRTRAAAPYCLTSINARRRLPAAGSLPVAERLSFGGTARLVTRACCEGSSNEGREEQHESHNLPPRFSFRTSGGAGDPPGPAGTRSCGVPATGRVPLYHHLLSLSASMQLSSLVVLLSRSSSWIGAWWVGSKWRK